MNIGDSSPPFPQETPALGANARRQLPEQRRQEDHQLREEHEQQQPDHLQHHELHHALVDVARAASAAPRRAGSRPRAPPAATARRSACRPRPGSRTRACRCRAPCTSGSMIGTTTTTIGTHSSGQPSTKTTPRIRSSIPVGPRSSPQQHLGDPAGAAEPREDRAVEVRRGHQQQDHARGLAASPASPARSLRAHPPVGERQQQHRRRADRAGVGRAWRSRP